ncbi:MAG: transketolase C-terminal domain-containing protein [Minisyncoccia bacterium]
MRNSFVKQALVEMKKNKNIFFLTGDLGFNALEPIRDAFPDRFINVGVAESNMIGVACGLALTGKTVIAYSIASFLTLRCFEQIRTDICYHNLDVKLFGAGGGYNYATHGITHHTVEDLAIMRSLPNMKVMNPAYAWEAEGATRVAFETKGPTYMRLGKSPSTHFEKPGWKFEIGKGYEVKKGEDVILLSTGNILDVVVEAGNILEKKLKKSISVISMPSVKPLDKKLILYKNKKAEAIFTIEENGMQGGFGGAVSELLMQSSMRPKLFKIFGLPDHFIKDVGSRNFLLNKAGLDSTSIVKTILKIYKK